MDKLKDTLEIHAKKYPKMQPCDAVKLIFQNEFGGRHLAEDGAGSLAALREELVRVSSDRCQQENGLIAEKIGNGRVRLNLSAMDPAVLPIECIHAIFMASSKKSDGSMASFFEKLAVLEAAAASGWFGFPAADLQSYIQAYKAMGCPPVHHSADFQEAYAPAYRVIDGRYVRLLPVIAEISRLQCLKEQVIVGIDGNAASGKSTAANLLAQVFDANIISMDDFFLPGDLRTKPRLDEIGGNVHYERFKEEVIDGLKKETAFKYRVFDCSALAYAGEKTVYPKPLNIIEGAYSMHPYFGDVYDLKVFFSISGMEQRHRILARNGENLYKQFVERWIPMENRYFEYYNVKDSCDIRIE